MKTIKSIDRPTLHRIESRMSEVLDRLGKELGISFKYKGATFTATSASIKFVASVINPDGEVMTPERRDYPLLCKMYGLEPEWLDRQFQENGRTFTVSGILRKAPKNAVLLTRDDGKQFRGNPQTVIMRLKMADMLAVGQ